MEKGIEVCPEGGESICNYRKSYYDTYQCGKVLQFGQTEN
jgi:hypothetical protein